MTKKLIVVTALAAVFGFVASASATTITGRVTTFSPTSISVQDKEIVTAGIDAGTVFTKLVAGKPWQENAASSFGAVRVGTFVVVHVADNSGFLANWIQVGDSPITYSAVTPAPFRYTDEALKHLHEARAHRAHMTASEAKRPGAVNTAAHCERLARDGAENTAVPKGQPYNNRLQKLGN